MNHIITPMNFSIQLSHIHFYHTYYSQQELLIILPPQIDNIFSNITDFETISGNITTLIADHFTWFLLIKKCPVSYKPSSYSVYDYSNFSKEKLIYDFWSFLSDSSASINDLYKKIQDDTTNFIDNHVSKKRLLRNI